jgi:hypothetical protein
MAQYYDDPAAVNHEERAQIQRHRAHAWHRRAWHDEVQARRDAAVGNYAGAWNEQRQAAIANGRTRQNVIQSQRNQGAANAIEQQDNTYGY